MNSLWDNSWDDEALETLLRTQYSQPSCVCHSWLRWLLTWLLWSSRGSEHRCRPFIIFEALSVVLIYISDAVMYDWIMFLYSYPMFTTVSQHLSWSQVQSFRGTSVSVNGTRCQVWHTHTHPHIHILCVLLCCQMISEWTLVAFFWRSELPKSDHCPDESPF